MTEGGAQGSTRNFSIIPQDSRFVSILLMFTLPQLVALVVMA